MQLLLVDHWTAVACLSQKSRCSAISVQPCWATLPQKQGDPGPPAAHTPSRSACALPAQAVSEGTSQVSTPKKLWVLLETGHSSEFPRTCLGRAEPSMAQPRHRQPDPEAVTHVRRAQRPCVGVKEQGRPHADICALRQGPNGEDLQRSPICRDLPSLRQPGYFQGDC